MEGIIVSFGTPIHPLTKAMTFCGSLLRLRYIRSHISTNRVLVVSSEQWYSSWATVVTEVDKSFVSYDLTNE
jgi:hypothetical protein